VNKADDVTSRPVIDQSLKVNLESKAAQVQKNCSTSSAVDRTGITSKEGASVNVEAFSKVKYIVFSDETTTSSASFFKSKDEYLVKFFPGFTTERMVEKIISSNFGLFKNLQGVILHVGIHDLFQFDIECALGGVWDLIRMSKHHLPSHVKVIFSGLLNCNRSLDSVTIPEFNGKLASVCKSESVVFIDPNRSLYKGVLSNSGLNLNKKGGRLLFNCWSKFSKLFCSGDCYKNAVTQTPLSDLGNSVRVDHILPP